MKVRSDFVTNSSSSSFVAFDIESDTLVEIFEKFIDEINEEEYLKYEYDFCVDEEMDDVDRITEIIECNNAHIVEELSKNVDYIICNNKNKNKKIIEFAKEFCIPVISEKGFASRFGKNPFSEENMDIYEEIFDCTYEGDFYEIFYKYGIGDVVRRVK